MRKVLRILVFSDTHKDTKRCIDVIQNIIGIDMIIHAGDHASDAVYLQKAFPNIPVRFVKGNCDFGDFPTELIIEADNKKIFLTHGHNYSVKYDYDYATILNRGKELDCDAIVFGHTHNSLCDIRGKITMLNPGSVCYGRTYGVIEIENDKLRAAICSM